MSPPAPGSGDEAGKWGNVGVGRCHMPQDGAPHTPPPSKVPVLVALFILSLDAVTPLLVIVAVANLLGPALCLICLDHVLLLQASPLSQ